MGCTACGGGFEFAGGGKYARCVRCQALFSLESGQPVPIVVQAPGGGNNPQFNAMFAQNLGFAPAQFAPQGGHAGHVPQHTSGTGVGTMLVQEAKSAIVWWLVGVGITVVVAVVGVVGVMWLISEKQAELATPADPGSAKASKWDGKAAFTCGAADVVKLENVTAKLDGTAISATAGCTLLLKNVNVTAPVCIDAQNAAKVTVSGGTYTCSQNSVVAQHAAEVKFEGAKVTGKSKASPGAKVTGL